MRCHNFCLVGEPVEPQKYAPTLYNDALFYICNLFEVIITVKKISPYQ